MKLYQYMIKGVLETGCKNICYSCEMSATTHEVTFDRGLYLKENGWKLFDGEFLPTYNNLQELLIKIRNQTDIVVTMFSLSPRGKLFINKAKNFFSALSDCSSVYSMLILMVKNEMPDESKVKEGGVINYAIRERTTYSSNDQTQC